MWNFLCMLLCLINCFMDLFVCLKLEYAFVMSQKAEKFPFDYFIDYIYIEDSFFTWRICTTQLRFPIIISLFLLHFRGSFDILGALELAPGIFQAHPPCRVSRKVYEFLGLLPDTLKLELVPRGDIWPSLFDNHCPGKKDIGLYFFESEKKRSDLPYISILKGIRVAK